VPLFFSPLLLAPGVPKLYPEINYQPPALLTFPLEDLPWDGDRQEAQEMGEF
jgi:hypothetical protein